MNTICKTTAAVVMIAVLVLGFTTCKKEEEKIDPPTVKVFEGAITVDCTKASVSAEVTNQGGAEVKSRGFIYGISGGAMDTIYCGSGTGVFSSDLNNLKPNTTYVYEAFAKNAGGMGISGKVTFTTRDLEMPKVKTSEAENVGMTTALCSGNVTDDGGVDVTQRGLCWSTNHNPTISDSHVLVGNGTGVFSYTITDLSVNTKYYFRAYAINDKGTAYGEEKSFTTLDYGLPELITTDVTDITQTTAKGGGNVTSDGGLTVTERGICWSSTHNPTVNNHKVPAGEGLGSYTCNITGLNAHTTYHVRSYATNNKGTAYGNEVSFNTSASLPTVTTGNITNIATTIATCGGNVTADGGATVTARGVCWSSSQNPTISNHHTTDGTGTGSFTSQITGLTPNTTYHVRAYATNSLGTNYGEQRSFTTSGVTVPTVTTNDVTNITQTTAICGGNVTDNGGATITACGVCWSTSQNPTLNNQHTSQVPGGSGVSNFTSYITGLTANQTYYVRAYATNSMGTRYGAQKTFMTATASTIEGWLYYGDWNNHVGNWGLTYGGTIEWAVMFPTSILSQYAGTSITKVDTYIGETGSYTLKIYKGGTNQPTTLVKTQNFTVTTTGWNTIVISPIALVTTSTLWVSITTTHNEGHYPMGSCAGINNPNARWRRYSSGNWSNVIENGWEDLCWEIHAWVTDQAKGEKGSEIQLPQTPANSHQIHNVKVSRNPHEGPKKYKR